MSTGKLNCQGSLAHPGAVKKSHLPNTTETRVKKRFLWATLLGKGLNYLLHRHRRNTRISPVNKIWVKIHFWSLRMWRHHGCQDYFSLAKEIIVVVIVLVFHWWLYNKHNKHLWIMFYLFMIKLILISTWTHEDKVLIHMQACNILYVIRKPSFSRTLLWFKVLFL